MSSQDEFFLMIIGVLCVIAIIIRFKGVKANWGRPDKLATLAYELNMEYKATDILGEFSEKYADLLGDFWKRYCAFGGVSHSYSARIFNIMTGELDGYLITAFDYNFVMPNSRYGSRATITIVAADLNFELEELHIRAEWPTDKLASAVGAGDVKFTYNEFSDTFYVTCASEAFAHEFITTPMMRYLLREPFHHIDIKHNAILITPHLISLPLSIEELEDTIGFMRGFLGTMPENLRSPQASKPGITQDENWFAQ